MSYRCDSVEVKIRATADQVVQNVAGKDALAVGAFFKASCRLLFTLADNAGLDSSELTARLEITAMSDYRRLWRQCHAQFCFCLAERRVTIDHRIGSNRIEF